MSTHWMSLRKKILEYDGGCTRLQCVDFMKPGDIEENSVSKILHLVRGAGLFNA
jgi:hypothetical protein